MKEQIHKKNEVSFRYGHFLTKPHIILSAIEPVLATDPATWTSSFVIITRKKPDISWTQYDRVVHYILEHICSDFIIAEDYTK